MQHSFQFNILIPKECWRWGEINSNFLPTPEDLYCNLANWSCCYFNLLSLQLLLYKCTFSYNKAIFHNLICNGKPLHFAEQVIFHWTNVEEALVSDFVNPLLIYNGNLFHCRENAKFSLIARLLASPPDSLKWRPATVRSSSISRVVILL